MNSVSNSDSKQYTESKLSWVHQVHTLTQAVCTLRVGPAVSWRTRRSVAASPWPYRGLPPIVSWACCNAHPTVLQQTPDRIVCFVARAASPRPYASCRRLLGGIASQARSCRSIVSRHAQRPSLPPVTMQAIVS